MKLFLFALALVAFVYSGSAEEIQTTKDPTTPEPIITLDDVKKFHIGTVDIPATVFETTLPGGYRVPVIVKGEITLGTGYPSSQNNGYGYSWGW